MSQRILITSAIPYINSHPHLGNLIGSILSADVYARYCRGMGKDTLFICGTDEYGSATEVKAVEEKCTPQALCDKYYPLHRDVYQWFDISFDYFGRTTTPKHTQIVQDIFMKLYQKDCFIEKSVKQMYCPNCNLYLADRFVEGTCPHCLYVDARGDQCDNCQKLLDPIQLIIPRCKVCRSSPIIRESDHLYLNLPKLENEIKQWIHESSTNNQWSKNAIAITQAWLKQGLEPRSITRDSTWGVPVPIIDQKLEKYSKKSFYVWFSAPIGYLSITADYLSNWQDWWSKGDVRLVQFMGKDNVVFHSIIFPGTLLGTQEKWTLVSDMSVTEYLSYETGKFSKSRGVGVFCNDAQNSGIPTDVWRYYLIAIRPETADSTFDWKDFQAKVNNDLVNTFGNFVHRVLTFVCKNYNKKVPQRGKCPDLIEKINREIVRYHEQFSQISLRGALQSIIHIADLGNKYLQASTPWKLIKENPEQCDTVCNICLQIVKVLGVLSRPFMPNVSTRIAGFLNVPHGNIPQQFVMDLPDNHCINEPQILFNRLEDSIVQALQQRFSGH